MTASFLARIPRRKSGLCSSVWAENLASMWFLLPIIVVFGVLTIVPLSQSFFYSLTDYDGWSSTFNFVWFDNYVRVFQAPDLLSALGFTLLYAFATTLVVTCLAIPLAVTLNKAMWGRSFARSLFFFLGVPAQAIIGLIWSYIFSPLSSGLVNKILAIFGIPGVGWLADDNLARFCVIFVSIWMQVGWHATLYLAFLQTIPADLYESARVDGANAGQQFVHITLPQLVPGIVVSMFLLMTGGLKIYDLPYTLTKGGPGSATTTLSQAILEKGIGQSEYGLGSALSVLFTVACIVVIVVQNGVASAVEKRFQ